MANEELTKIQKAHIDTLSTGQLSKLKNDLTGLLDLLRNYWFKDELFDFNSVKEVDALFDYADGVFKIKSEETHNQHIQKVNQLMIRLVQAHKEGKPLYVREVYPRYPEDDREYQITKTLNFDENGEIISSVVFEDIEKWLVLIKDDTDDWYALADFVTEFWK